MDSYANIVFALAAVGAGGECIVIIVDYVITSFLSMLKGGV